jgi:UDP-2-acetamido-3-amino-2,3-dideoxy-glucuronate N-acetyltransferase
MSYFVHKTAVVDEGATIGEGTKVWHFCHLLPKCKIGPDCVIGQNCVIFDHVELGKNVHVQNNVSIYTGVICEDDVFLGPSMVFTNISNPRSEVNRSEQYEETRVKKGASIGANATIVSGNTLGRYSFVGAGAVVTKPVPDYALVVGNPARHIGWMSEHGYRLHFDDNNEAECPGSGDKYKLQDGEVVKIDSDV